MNNFRLLLPSKATEDPKCFVGIDIRDSFKIIWLIEKKKKKKRKGEWDTSDDACASRFLATYTIK